MAVWLFGCMADGIFWTNGCKSILFGRKKSAAMAKSRFFRKRTITIPAPAKTWLALFQTFETFSFGFPQDSVFVAEPLFLTPLVGRAVAVFLPYRA